MNSLNLRTESHDCLSGMQGSHVPWNAARTCPSAHASHTCRPGSDWLVLGAQKASPSELGFRAVQSLSNVARRVLKTESNDRSVPDSTGDQQEHTPFFYARTIQLIYLL